MYMSFFYFFFFAHSTRLFFSIQFIFAPSVANKQLCFLSSQRAKLFFSYIFFFPEVAWAFASCVLFMKTQLCSLYLFILISSGVSGISLRVVAVDTGMFFFLEDLGFHSAVEEFMYFVNATTVP